MTLHILLSYLPRIRRTRLYCHEGRGGAYILLDEWEVKATVDDEWVAWVRYKSLITGKVYETHRSRWDARFYEISPWTGARR